ncbi:MAG: hypothetical protein MRJ67_01500 [Nitrospirales bacterium]|nr:hypothetical protein [Nitrospirales bacterium]
MACVIGSGLGIPFGTVVRNVAVCGRIKGQMSWRWTSPVHWDRPWSGTASAAGCVQFVRGDVTPRRLKFNECDRVGKTGVWP